MSVATESSLYYLIVQGREDDAIFIFLGRNPAQDSSDAPIAMPVTLDMLPLRQRFGGGGGIAMGLTFLGRWPGGMERFRQFSTLMELEQGGWLPVPRYRICDCWEDFYTPWSTPPENPSSNRGPMDQTGNDDDVDTEDDFNTKNSASPAASVAIEGSVETVYDYKAESSVSHPTSIAIDGSADAEVDFKGNNSVSPATSKQVVEIADDELSLWQYAIDLGR